MIHEVSQVAALLRQGGVVLYPTDTVWGIGCDATNEKAIQRIYDIKRRADNKSLLVLIDSPAHLPRYVEQVPEVAYAILSDSDRPTTIIYEGAYHVASNLLGQDRTLGIRVTSEVFSRSLCEELGHPLVSSSANISGAPTPHFFHEISDEIKDAVDYVVKYRQSDTTPSSPSRILKLGTHGGVEIIRP